MPTVVIPASPLAPGITSLAIHVRDTIAGSPLLILHGGWGYGFYPFDAQIAALPARRFVIPDRTGYGASPRVSVFPPRFHAAAALEALAVLDALAIDRCTVWGHSDGAVIAALLAIAAPTRVDALILEALHLERAKPGSRAFFTMMAEDPDAFGERVTTRLAADLGPDWRTPIRADGRVWLDIAATPDDDLFDRRLAEITAPTLVLHGSNDPRTEPGELDRLRRDLPHAELHILDGATHSPHSERDYSGRCAELVASFLG
ncbi:MAG: alpha/beta hydrolase [Deltaproteobacteria bacterium]|nr:alpha/beta hydrolase [Deltaproteobacteria bacterium]